MGHIGKKDLTNLTYWYYWGQAEGKLLKRGYPNVGFLLQWTDL
jgi:hypothetical protein